MLQFQECYESGGAGDVGRDGSDEYSIIVWGDPVADNADDSVAIMLFAIPKFAVLSKFGHVATTFSYERIAPAHWKVTGKFTSRTSERPTNDASFTFTSGGGSQHITTSLATISSYANSAVTGLKVPANHHGAIGVAGDSVQGVDIDVPGFDFKVTFYVSTANMSQDYLGKVYSLSGSVNSDTVTVAVDDVTLVFQPGELLYRQGEGSKRRGFEDWEFSLNFSAQKNRSGLSIGPFAGVTADGWDYIWSEHQPGVDGSANAIIRPPIGLYVERVYPRNALTPLLLKSAFGLSNAQPWMGLAPVSGGGLTT